MIRLRRKCMKLVFFAVRYYSECSSKGPLDGIRICDMTRVLTGPYCTMVLGDMGAEVIKIERPGVGDETRAWGPPFVGNESCYFLSVNRNKKGVCVNIKDAEGRKIIHDIVKKSDVFVENFVPGKLSELGFGYDELRQMNSGLIYASISGFGSHGPYHEKPGYDVTASAYGGLISITGPKDGEPCRPGVAITDLMAGLFIVDAVVAALYERNDTGVGKNISTSLLQTQVAMLSHVAANVLNTDAKAERFGTSHPSIVPYQIFDTADGKLAAVAANNEDFTKLCKILDIEHLATDPNFDDNSKRVKNRELLVPQLEKILRTKGTSYWLSVMDEAGISSSPLHNIKEAYDKVVDLNVVQELDHITAGPIKVPGPAVDYGGHLEPSAPPVLGGHTHDVLKSILSYSDKEIERLVESKVVFAP